jgi:hypothetical protein
MSSPLWQRFPVEPGLRALEMKDRPQERVMEDTKGASPAPIASYFRKASRRFRQEVGCAPGVRHLTDVGSRRRPVVWQPLRHAPAFDVEVRRSAEELQTASWSRETSSCSTGDAAPDPRRRGRKSGTVLY